MLQTITLNNSAAVGVVYNLKSVQGQSAVYMAPTSSISEPKTLAIDVVSKDLNSTASDRISVRAQTVVRDASGSPVAVNFSAQIVLPRNTIITDAIRKDCYATVMNYLATAGVWDSLTDGIIP